MDAVRHFCTQDSLRYDWLAYLPGPHITDQFWKQFRETVIAKLSDYPILLTRGGNLKLPRDLEHLSDRHCEQHGEPLFDDLDSEIYLSPFYSWSEHENDLTCLGVTGISYPNLLARLDLYLRRPRPRILEPTYDDDWHTRVANLLMRAMRNHPNVPAVTGRIKEMSLIPLSDGWLSANGGDDIYFPDDSQGNAIPGALRLHIVELTALENEARRSLFEMLGVSHCDPAFVINRILARYNRPHGVTLENSISHLRYLYWTLPRRMSLDDRIFLMDQHESPIYRKFVTFGQDIVVDDLYFETPGEYGTKQLAQKMESAAREHDTQDFEMHFIHESYIGAVSNDVRRNGRSWEKWLEDMGSVRRVPKLRESFTSDRLSNLFRYVIELESDIFIGLLKTYWTSYESEITPEIAREVENVEVPCQGHDRLFPLKSTHFPSAELRILCSQATVSNLFEWFLVIPSCWTTDTDVGWEFLGNFGVGTQPGLVFFEDVFSVLTEELTPDQALTGFFQMYEELSARFHGTHSDEIK